MASHIEVAHRWAQGVYLSEGEAFPRPLKGFNMWSEGASIYSYGRHFEIARIVRSPNAGNVVLMTTRGYSISTSKHITYTRRAIPSEIQVFDVENFDETPDVTLEAYVKRAIAEQAKASRARVYVQHHLDRAQSELAEAERFAAAFGVAFERPALADLSQRAADMAKREREAQKAAAVERAQREAAQRELDAGDFAAWQAREAGSRCPYSYSRTTTGGAYLRRSPNGESLETSQGASVPWDHALKAFRFVKLVRERGEPWARNGRQVRVGHYQLDRIEASGDFKAGCHFIEWAQIEVLAAREGVLDAAPSAEAVTTSNV